MENRVKTIEALGELHLFKDLPPELVQQLAQQSDLVEVAKDELIIKKGDDGDSMYLVMRGAVSVHDEDRLLATLIVGEYFGEYALIDRYERSASVTATQPAELLRLDRDMFNRIMQQNIELKEAILRVLIKRLRNLNDMQEQLFKSNREISAKNQEIERINEELNRVNEEKTNIMNVLAHDLRNNLTSSISLGETISEDLKEVSPDLKSYMERLNKSLWRMSERIDRMLAVKAKLEDAPMNLSEFSLTELIDNLKIQFQNQALQKGVKLVFKPGDFLVTLDKSNTRQILENLVGNAIRFSPGSSKVSVHAYEESDHILISVSDQGPGLTAEALKPLTEPMSEDEIKVVNPSDLSLSIVRKLTESMGGTVTCDSQPGKGAKFVLRFDQFRRRPTEKGFWDIFK